MVLHTKASSECTLAGPPGPPVAFDVTSDALALSWDAPANTGGRAVRGYQVPASPAARVFHPITTRDPVLLRRIVGARADWGHQRLCGTAARHRERGGARGRERAAAGQVVPSEHPRTRAARTNSRVARRRAKPQGPRVARGRYEFRVAAWTARGLGAAGSPGQPVHTGEVGERAGAADSQQTLRPAVESGRAEPAHHGEAGAAAMTRERGFELEELRPRSDRERAAPVDSSERPRRYRETRRHKRQLEEGAADACLAAEDRRALAREYRRVKKRIATWEADFARIEGRPPNARDIAEDKARQRDTNFDRPSQRPRARVDLTPCRFPGPAGACAPRSQAQDAPA